MNENLSKDISIGKQRSLNGCCKCGKVQYESPCGTDIGGVFYCHCSRCPQIEAEIHGGVGWAAIPRPQYNGPLYLEASTCFAIRGYCKECRQSLFIRYLCEDYTDWVLKKTIQTKVNVPKPWHIHCEGKRSEFNDDFPICPGWTCWDPDPCRPKLSRAPKICFRCFLKSDTCGCPGGPLLDRPEDGFETNEINIIETTRL